jgi:glycosyltransferase involved in cell wall biosynthesis
MHIVLFSNTREKLGGADRCWVNLANALGPERIRLTWVGVSQTECLRPLLKPELQTRFIDTGMPLWAFLTHENMFERRSPWLWAKILGRQWQYLQPGLATVRRQLSNDVPDLVVTNSSVVHLGALYARKVGRPHVWCVKEWLDPDIGACRTFARVIEMLSTTVTVPSRAMAPAFRKPVVCHDGCDVAAVINGVKRSREQVLAEWGLPANRPLIVQAAEHYPWKGAHVAAGAFSRLAAGGGPPAASLVFLGGGNSEYKRRVESVLAQLPPAWREAVRWKTYPAGDFSSLAAADIVLHTPVMPDPWPNALHEAMVLGKPIVAPRAGGPGEMLHDGRTGLLAEPGDEADFAKAVSRLLKDPAHREQIGKAAKDWALANLNIAVLKEGFWEVFQKAAR